jgi:hypothetical protein
MYPTPFFSLYSGCFASAKVNITKLSIIVL